MIFNKIASACNISCLWLFLDIYPPSAKWILMYYHCMVLKYLIQYEECIEIRLRYTFFLYKQLHFECITWPSENEEPVEINIRKLATICINCRKLAVVPDFTHFTWHKHGWVRHRCILEGKFLLCFYIHHHIEYAYFTSRKMGSYSSKR